jgi:hypothetical protein
VHERNRLWHSGKRKHRTFALRQERIEAQDELIVASEEVLHPLDDTGSINSAIVGHCALGMVALHDTNKLRW